MFRRTHSPYCVICGKPSRHIMRGRGRASSFCSFRCKMIGERNWYLLGAIFFLFGTVLTVVLTYSTNEWYIPIVFAITFMLSSARCYLGRKYYKEDLSKHP